MHLLISNDDGYKADGIRSLAKAAVSKGHTVVVCAPLTEQSATSHHLTIFKPLLVKNIPTENMSVYAVDGSPADSVRVARYLSEQPFDFCLSGINNGENVAAGVYYSGTVAAAREATMNGLPAIAVSIARDADEDMRMTAAYHALEVMEHLVQHPMPPATFCNLNFPALPKEKIKGFKVTPISESYFTDGYEKRFSPRDVTYFWMEDGEQIEEPKPGTDLYCLREGYATCTFISTLSDRNHAYADLEEVLQIE